MNRIKKSVSVLLAAVVLSMTTSCYGDMALTKNVWQWNDSAVSNKFLKSLLMVGMIIIPVYGVCVFVDVVIFNLIEFWGGSNPISMNEGDFEKQVIPFEGEDYIVEATKNQFKIYQEGEEPVYLRFEEASTSWSVVYEGNSQQLVSTSASAEDNDMKVYNGDVVTSLDMNQHYSAEMLGKLFPASSK